MADYLFLLGNTPQLALAELNSVLQRGNLTPSRIYSSAEVVDLSFAAPLSPEELISKLGGTVKIAAVLGRMPAEKIKGELSRLALERSNGKRLNFGVSVLGKGYNSKDLAIFLKRELEAQGRKSQFFLPALGKNQLSTVVVQKQHVTEFLVLEENSGWVIAHTVVSSDFADWGKRDYGRPEAQGHLGMLPPKVARMMINLGLPPAAPDKAVLLDPFCGSGTILAEAAVLGLSVYGSDLSSAQLGRTNANLAWLATQYRLTFAQNLQVADARGVSAVFPQASVDLIVTEPDLGPNVNTAPTPALLSRLTDLYLRSLADWTKILKNGGKVVMALPGFVTEKNTPNTPENLQVVKTVIDKSLELGYSFSEGSYRYARPQARVSRNVCVFQKK